MLRVLWGDSSLEQSQAREILTLRAELADLREKHLQNAQEAARSLQQAYDGFMSFLKPRGPQEPLTQPIAREMPGDRPETAPVYLERPPWADDEVVTAVPV